MRVHSLVFLALLAVPSLVRSAEPVCYRQSTSGSLATICLHGEGKQPHLISLEIDNQTVFVVRLEFADSITLKQTVEGTAGKEKYVELAGGCRPVLKVLGDRGLLCNFSLGGKVVIQDIGFNL
jgi:hypothetical protein